MSQPNQPSRLAWIDALKGMGIIVVACGHHPALWANSEALGRAIFSFSMPLFFFISGLTLDRGMSAKALATRALSCLVPYFALSLTSIPMIFRLHPDAALIDVLLGIFYGTGHTIFTVPLWFLPCLTLTLGLVYLLDKIDTRLAGGRAHRGLITQLLLFAVLQVGWQLCISADYRLGQHIGWGDLLTSGAPWSAEVALAGASYVVLGRLFSQQFGSASWMKKPQWGFALLVAAAFVAMNMVFHPEVDLNWRYDRPLALSPLVALTGIAASVLLALSIRNSVAMSVLRWLGTTTILILWLHATLEKTAFKLLAPHLGSFAALTVSLLLALLIPALISSALKKLPWVHGFIAPHPFLKRFITDKAAGKPMVRRVRTE